MRNLLTLKKWINELMDIATSNGHTLIFNKKKVIDSFYEGLSPQEVYREEKEIFDRLIEKINI